MSERNAAGEIQYVGACRVNIELDRGTVSWDEPIVGAVVLRGGKSDETVHRTQFRLEQAVPSGQVRTLASLSPIREFCVPAGSTERIPFCFPPMTTAPFDLSVQAMVTARFYVDFGPGSVGIPLWVEPTAEFQRIATALYQVVGVGVRWTGSTQGVVGAECLLWFKPELRGWLDAVTLSWPSTKDARHLRLCIDRAERSAADLVRALASRDKQTLTLTVDPDDPEGMREQFSRLLNPYLPRPELVRNLPIPEERSSPGAEALPRPSAAPELDLAERPIPSDKPTV